MKKNKRITAKSVIASILVVALLFNLVSPAYAREGNVGEGNGWTAMALGAFNGATASSTIGWTQWAVGLFVQVAVGYADLYYFTNHYSDYGRALISLNIGGTHINISRGQMVNMVASVAAGTVAGVATGGGISLGSVVNDLTNSFTRTVIGSVVTQILVKKFGLDPNLANIASQIVTSYVSAHWDLITRIVPQAGTMLDELIDPNDKQQEYTRGFLKKLREGSTKAGEESESKDKESDKSGDKSTKEGSNTFTREELASGIALTEGTINNLKKQQEQLSKEWWHLSSARKEERKEELQKQIDNQEIFLGGLYALAADVENNKETRESPPGAPIKSVQDGLADGVAVGLRSMIDENSDPVAKVIKKGVDGFVTKALTVVVPSLPERMKGKEPVPIELKRSVNAGEKGKDTGGVSLRVGQTIKPIINGVPTDCEITTLNDDGKYTITRLSDDRPYYFAKTAEGGYIAQPVDLRIGDIIPLAKEEESMPTNYNVIAVNDGKYTATVGIDNRPYSLAKTAEGGYIAQPVDVRIGDIIPLIKEGETTLTNYTVTAVNDNGKNALAKGPDNRPYSLTKTGGESYTIQAIDVRIGEGTPLNESEESVSSSNYPVNAVRYESELTVKANPDSSYFDRVSNVSDSIQSLNHAEATQNVITESFYSLTPTHQGH
jgi:hypothetical protein